MEKSNNDMIKAVVQLKRENEELEELINFLKMENFDYALKCNHLQNVLDNIQTVVQTSPGKLVSVSDNICNILQIGGSSGRDKVGGVQNEKSGRSILQTSEKPTVISKAHVVNPHMVNGHILYVPTINLTRVSSLNAPADKTNENNSMGENETEETLSLNHSSMSLNHENGDVLNDTPSTNEEFQSDNQLSPIEEVNEPSTSSQSKSPSHSTVLSGTFQEVKIYLNQISSESLQEESKTLKRKTKSKSNKTSKSPTKTSRSDELFTCITKRKKS